MILLGKYKVLLTHGHYYNVTVGVERLKEEARERGIDIAMFGHTHRPSLKPSSFVILPPSILTLFHGD